MQVGKKFSILGGGKRYSERVYCFIRKFTGWKQRCDISRLMWGFINYCIVTNGEMMDVNHNFHSENLPKIRENSGDFLLVDRYFRLSI